MAASSSSPIPSGFNFSYFNEGNSLKTLLSQTPEYLVESETTTDETGKVTTITTKTPNPDHIFVAKLFKSHLNKFIEFGDLIFSNKNELCIELEKDRVIYPEMMKEYSSKWNKTLLLVRDIFSTTIPSALIAAIGYAGVRGILFSISPPPIIKKGISKLQKPMYGFAIISGLIAYSFIFQIFSNISWSNFGFYMHPLRQLGPSTALTKVTDLRNSALALDIKKDDVDGLNAFLDRLPQSSSLNPETITRIKDYAENVISALSILQIHDNQTLLDGLLPVATFDEARASTTSPIAESFERDIILTTPPSRSPNSQSVRANYRPTTAMNESHPLLERRRQITGFRYPEHGFSHTRPHLFMMFKAFCEEIRLANQLHQGL